MENAIHYIEVKGNLKQVHPVIELEGAWLRDFGYDINQKLKVKVNDNQITLTATSGTSRLFPVKMNGPYDYSPEQSIVDGQRLQASKWLDQCSKKHPEMSGFLYDIVDAYVLRRTVFDFIHVLCECNLLGGSDA